MRHNRAVRKAVMFFCHGLDASYHIFREASTEHGTDFETKQKASPKSFELHPSREPRARNPLFACSLALRAQGFVAHLQQALAHDFRYWMSFPIGQAREILWCNQLQEGQGLRVRVDLHRTFKQICYQIFGRNLERDQPMR